MSDSHTSSRPVQRRSLRRSRFFRNSLVSTLVAVLLCLSTHLMALFGIAGTIAWLGHLEHALLFLTVALAALTAYAVIRHRKGGCEHAR